MLRQAQHDKREVGVTLSLSKGRQAFARFYARLLLVFMFLLVIVIPSAGKLRAKSGKTMVGECGCRA